MNQVATIKPKPLLLEHMAEKYMLRPEEFSKTVRATCGLATATPEQFAAFMMVAKTYNLNPITKEIYAFPGRGGGIVPIVSIDGWINLVNSNPNCDGFEFEMEHDDEGKLVACTCKMYRKDRKVPVTVTEYLSECVRQTDPWKMQHRMLRHKALIQAARYAFGYAGIYDEDEGRTIAEAVDVTPPRVPSPSEVEGKVIDMKKDDPITSGPQKASKGPDFVNNYDAWFDWCLTEIRTCDDGEALETFFNDEIEAKAKDIFPTDMADLADEFGKRQEQLRSADENG
jgi:phage recombination protein Bet